jgi:hypothetical protein
LPKVTAFENARVQSRGDGRIFVAAEFGRSEGALASACQADPPRKASTPNKYHATITTRAVREGVLRTSLLSEQNLNRARSHIHVAATGYLVEGLTLARTSGAIILACYCLDD